MEFPVKLQFKIAALAPQISVIDANGQTVFYVKQKLFKLKEAITVFSDSSQTTPLYYINADRVNDFSASYDFTDTNGIQFGSVKRKGRRSIWRAHYEIFDDVGLVASIEEENAWAKVGDALFGEIPVIGILSGYVFNPTYRVTRPDGTVIVRIKKQPALFESNFTIEEAIDISEASEVRTVLAILMMTLLERARG